MLDESDYIISTSATSISISWEEHRVPRADSTYTIKYRKKSGGDFMSKTTKNNFEEIDELQNDTEHQVNVYWEDADGDNNPLFKAVCKTKKSGTDYLKAQHTSVDKTRKGQPVLYQFLPVQKREIKGNDKDKSAKSEEDSTNSDGLQICDMIAEYDPGIYTSNEKTVLLLGATGTGKSTLIDGLINYIAGVSYNDEYRFSLIHKTKEERIQSENPGESQTSTTTVYRIPELEGSNVNCKVNIIDTIGFIDTRKDFDKKLIKQLQTLFGGIIEHIDAVLIVIPLSTTRLTEGQEYIFSSISKLFGKEIEENMCVAITHDDGGEATCLGLLEKAIKTFPQGKVFRFNNAFVLKKSCQTDKSREIPFDENKTKKEQEDNWRNRSVTFSKLLNKMNTLPKTTVQSSHEVMVARHRLQIKLKALESSIMEQAQRIVNYKRAKTLQYNNEANNEETYQTFSTKKVVYKHQYTGNNSINCSNCKRTCHGGCWVPFDLLTWTCEAIVDGKCIVCKNNCSVENHVREKYEYKFTTEEHVFTVAEFVESFEESFLEFQKTVIKVNTLIKELASKALRPDVLSTQGYIEQIIERNNTEKQKDYESRGEVLNKVKYHMEKGVTIWDLTLAHLIK